MRARDFVRTVAAGALAAAVVVGGAATASAQEKVVVANGDDRGSDGPRAFLLKSGLVTTGLAYTPALIVALKSDRSEDEYLFAPFVGPFLDLANRHDENKAARTLLVLDSIFQTLGLLQLIASCVPIERVSDVGAANSTASTWSQTAVAPARLSEDGYGLVAQGRF
jgi:hypothetical protein